MTPIYTVGQTAGLLHKKLIFVGNLWQHFKSCKRIITEIFIFKWKKNNNNPATQTVAM